MSKSRKIRPGCLVFLSEEAAKCEWIFDFFLKNRRWHELLGSGESDVCRLRNGTKCDSEPSIWPYIDRLLSSIRSYLGYSLQCHCMTMFSMTMLDKSREPAALLGKYPDVRLPCADDVFPDLSYFRIAQDFTGAFSNFTKFNMFLFVKCLLGREGAFNWWMTFNYIVIVLKWSNMFVKA